jgi:hypothetical protein
VGRQRVAALSVAMTATTSTAEIADFAEKTILCVPGVLCGKP